MQVLLYNVGRNLNRVCRTCFAFGVKELVLIGYSDSCSWEVRGNLYSAKDKINIIKLEELPNLQAILALENYYSIPIQKVNWSKIEGILIGNETTGLPHNLNYCQKAYIETVGRKCLTVEAALAIALYEWNCHGNF